MNAELLTDSLPVRKDSIEELCGHRNRAIELAKQGILLLAEAEAAARRAAPMDNYAGFVHDLCSKHSYSMRHVVTGDPDSPSEDRDRMTEIMATVIAEVDQHAWASLQKLSGLRTLMDDKARREFEEQLAKQPPAFTADNITATYMSLAADAGNIFERGLVNVFNNFNPHRYKTNSAFKIGPRAVLAHVFTEYGSWNYYARYEQQLIDLDRVFHVLDGKKPPEGSTAADVIYFARKEKKQTAETPYFTARIFHGNGNVHLKFTRLDLVNRANDIIARHFGATLPDERRAA
jgi:hypothetical protein